MATIGSHHDPLQVIQVLLMAAIPQGLRFEAYQAQEDQFPRTEFEVLLVDRAGLGIYLCVHGLSLLNLPLLRWFE